MYIFIHSNPRGAGPSQRMAPRGAAGLEARPGASRTRRRFGPRLSRRPMPQAYSQIMCTAVAVLACRNSAFLNRHPPPRPAVPTLATPNRPARLRPGFGTDRLLLLPCGR